MPFFEKNGCKFYYEIHGAGAPLVLLHGLCADGYSWLPVRRALSANFRLVIPDNRLSGRSTCPPGPVSIKRLAEDLRDLLDHLGIAKTAVAGHSMGGYAAQEFAIAFPERAEKLVLESTAAVSSNRNKALFTNLADELQSRGYTELFWKNFFPWLISPSFYDRPKVVERIIKITAGYPYLPSPLNFARQVAASYAHDTVSRLARIKARTLILSGGCDILITPDESRALAAAIPRAGFTLVKNAAHTIHFEQPDLFAKTLSAFLTLPAAEPSFPRRPPMRGRTA